MCQKGDVTQSGAHARAEVMTHRHANGNRSSARAPSDLDPRATNERGRPLERDLGQNPNPRIRASPSFFVFELHHQSSSAENSRIRIREVRKEEGPDIKHRVVDLARAVL